MDNVTERMRFFLILTLEWINIHEEENRKETNSGIVSNCVSYTYVGLGT